MPAATLADSLWHPSRRAARVAHLGVVRRTRPSPPNHAFRRRSLLSCRFRWLASFRLRHVSLLQRSIGSRLHCLDRNAALGSSSLHGFSHGALLLSRSPARLGAVTVWACSCAGRFP